MSEAEDDAVPFDPYAAEPLEKAAVPQLSVMSEADAVPGEPYAAEPPDEAAGPPLCVMSEAEGVTVNLDPYVAEPPEEAAVGLPLPRVMSAAVDDTVFEPYAAESPNDTAVSKPTNADSLPEEQRSTLLSSDNTSTAASLITANITATAVVDDDDEEIPYGMAAGDDNVCGLCVVFNMVKFSKKDIPDRCSSENDAKLINQFFRKFGFKVVLKTDQSKTEIKEYLRDAANTYRQNWSCFVCFVLSHGKDEDSFCDVDGVDVKVSSLVRRFDCKRCPQMDGKPKLFFVQKCRGKELMEGVVYMDAVVSDDDDDINRPLTSLDPDTLISFSTTPGYVSFRKDTGSDYIQHFVQMLDKYGSTRDLEKILRLTTKHVSGQAYQKKGYKMCPCYRSTLRKPVLFHKPPTA